MLINQYNNKHKEIKDEHTKHTSHKQKRNL